ncbi:YraN family protein [Tumebacillus flagellatus]|uniref:UPF0102 protein EL26_12450 n=1 Tax=Tumebacillus flagellatus TaxID=1157490 RepID=A0A074LL85_9BACL|nr:YraN family protein [Tumebacillus flagellatus]KEO82901.1 hypothetical protein EL26_12450 [Tumebacillus flagellatus]
MTNRRPETRKQLDPREQTDVRKQLAARAHHGSRNQPDLRKQLGDFGEGVASEYLLRGGYTILARNWRRRGGELDIVATDGRALVFVEVRTRSTRHFGTAEESVDWRKQRQVRKMASCFLYEGEAGENGYRDIRFDVVTVYVDRDSGEVRSIRHLPHAF